MAKKKGKKKKKKDKREKIRVFSSGG